MPRGRARELALRTSTVALVVKISLANAGNVRDTGSISGSGRSLEEEMAQKGLAGYHPWGGKESDMTEW